MTITYKNFIGKYEGVYPAGFCQHIINEFEYFHDKGAVRNRFQAEGAPNIHKDDLNTFFSFRGHNPADFEGKNTISLLQEGIQKCFDEYATQYSPLRNDSISGSILKVQKTIPGAGYHIWHHEQGSSLDTSNRVLVYLLYLNTIDEGNAGETEFLYQQERVRPIENTLIIWPAAFTHTHRGNTVFGDKAKYIVTGWFNYDV